MASMGLPVPPGIVIPLDAAAVDEPAIASAVQALLAKGPVIARAALAGEDEAEQSAAGLGTSIGAVTDLEGLRSAVLRIAELRDEPWLRSVRLDRSTSDDMVIVQQEIAVQWIVVAALLRDGFDYVEIHRGGSDALAAGTSPVYAGNVGRWDDAARDALERTFGRLRDHIELGPHGLDVEVVIDHDDSAWAVQARPIVRDVFEGWHAFEAELRRLGQLDQLEGVLVLDAEHNPAPLSVAHTWLMHWLAQARPSAGQPTVLAGWLYVRTLPRDLGRRPAETTALASPEPQQLAQVLHHLRDVLVPEARRRLCILEDRLEHADRTRTAAAIDDALDTFVWMIDQYLGVLVPARARGLEAASTTAPCAVTTSHTLSTHGREAFADVLPASWDIASPTLAELGWGLHPQTSTELEIPTDPAAAATLLGEWDDHLFALGLAPLRRVYRRAGALLELGDAVFLLEGEELRSALLGKLDVAHLRLRERADALHRYSQLHPPLRIEDGHPVPTAPAARMRGIGIGRSVEGRVAKRRDLQHLLGDPPQPDAIVVIPALTAQAAVALRDLGVRAVCCAHGGALSHATLMARELGLSALVGCRGCLDLPDGAAIRLEPRLGRLLLGPAAEG
jgi:phosphohistidine swiveling domain-containing protein